MKNLIILLLISSLSSINISGQVYIGNTGFTSFFSETPMENISAENKNVSAALNIATKDVAVRIQNAAFRFPNKLMEEHFNENYMESEKYPISTFKGKFLENIDGEKDGTYEVTVKGILEIHGVKQDKVFKAKISKLSDKLDITCNFDIKLADHNIEIPKLVFEKIAETIAVKNKFSLTLKKP